ncbi:hypothetical protein [Citricoccus alkalitolerans]|uniref:Phosphodiesterase n=1 Tax=Citricoccus alkalitolerans TaxID=246603 RepID=A0ABV8XZW4_9MICC
MSAFPLTPFVARHVGTALAGAAGLVLGVGLGAIGAVRRNRPVHSVGAVVPGALVINTPGTTGSDLFDTAAHTPLIARLSRSASWPVALPDVIGLALRIPGGGSSGRPADLLFSSTGTGRHTRYVLRFHTAATDGPLTTMFPLTGPAGNIVFRLDPEAGDCYRLSYSRNSGPWQGLGRVSLESPPEPPQRSSHPAGADDPGLRFRPIAHPPIGLAMPTWQRAARAPAYSIARYVWHS